MKMSFGRKLGATVMAVSLLLGACTSAGTNTQPVAKLSAPAAGTQFTAGQVINIAGKVTGSDVKSVDVVVDTQRVATVDRTSAPNEFVINVPWPLEGIGQHVIQLRGLNANKEVIASDSVFVAAIAPAAVAAPTSAAPPTTAPQPTAVPPTAAPQPTAVPSFVTVTSDFARVRGGPGTTNPELGQLKKDEKATVRGKNDDGTWWMIDYSGKEGWIFGELVTFTGDAGKVEVRKPGAAGTPAASAAATSAPAGEAAATTAPAAPRATVAVDPNALRRLPTVPPPAAAPTALPGPTAVPAPTLPPAAAEPYRQNMRFKSSDGRDDIGDVPLGHNGALKTADLLWDIRGATRAELEITTFAGGGIFSACPAGQLSSVSGAAAPATTGRLPLSLPSGTLSFGIEQKGYYLFKIYVTKADGSNTDIPRAVLVSCYKSQ